MKYFITFCLLCIGAATSLSIRPDSPNRCPAIEPGSGGICAFMCGPRAYGSDCGRGKICCPSACGGTSCVTPVVNQPVRYPPGPPCRPGVSDVHCYVDPCLFATCGNIQGATCRSDYCGGCFARWFTSNDVEVTDSCNAY